LVIVFIANEETVIPLTYFSLQISSLYILKKKHLEKVFILIASRWLDKGATSRGR
jgi:hypothetical protein